MVDAPAGREEPPHQQLRQDRRHNDRLEKIAQGERRTLADIKGSGQITHIWVTIAPPPPAVSRHDIIVRMYWDDETTPSVEAPIGEFFGQGWNESYPMAALPLAAGPREGRAMVSYFPMPFRSHARIEIETSARARSTAGAMPGASRWATAGRCGATKER